MSTSSESLARCQCAKRCKETSKSSGTGSSNRGIAFDWAVLASYRNGAATAPRALGTRGGERTHSSSGLTQEHPDGAANIPFFAIEHSDSTDATAHRSFYFGVYPHTRAFGLLMRGHLVVPL